jgi:hypothetical protein
MPSKGLYNRYLPTFLGPGNTNTTDKSFQKFLEQRRTELPFVLLAGGLLIARQR